MLPPIAGIFDKKKLLRERMKLERDHAAAARPDAAVHAARNFMSAIDIADGDVVSLYDPMRNELDPRPLAEALLEKGAIIALPVVRRKKAPLIFRKFTPRDTLIDGAYGEQIPDETAPEITPDIVLAPMLAFSKGGGRLGYGGGFYDRTLVQLRADGNVIAVGYAYGAQEVDDLPLSPLDQPLDWVVTERGAFRCV
ncbi:MAG: 5-formyltetrahydrofolate cyclo-ligase [Marinicaulis sp.]|nr:5-formyltetrahydrofolate cyclo-ligase [Marinicaulis sp.]NNL87833.1 5-formyltetrahydrofolate cyclo-ligase [Marinicaulis sp.]